MKSGYLLQRIGVTLGLSMLLAISYPMAANGDPIYRILTNADNDEYDLYDTRPVIEDANGAVWVGIQQYDEQLHKEMRIPFDTIITTEGNSRVAFTYDWLTTINHEGRRLDAICAKTFFMRNKEANAKQFEHRVNRVIRRNISVKCNVTDDNALSRAERTAMQDESIVSITYYAKVFPPQPPTNLKPQSPSNGVFGPSGARVDPVTYTTPEVDESQARMKYFWESWWE